MLELDHDLKRMPLPRTLFWNNLALDLIAVGRTDEARRYLTRALAHSQDAGLMELLGLTYSQQGAIDEAERCWRQAESWDPDNADVCLDLGRLALSRNRWGEAVELPEARCRSIDRCGRASLQSESGLSDAGQRCGGGTLPAARRSATAGPAGGGDRHGGRFRSRNRRQDRTAPASPESPR